MHEEAVLRLPHSPELQVRRVVRSAVDWRDAAIIRDERRTDHVNVVPDRKFAGGFEEGTECLP